MPGYPYPDPPVVDPIRPIRPEQALALAIVRLALADARSRGAWHRSAIRFLRDDGDGMLSWWLEVAGFDERTRATVRERIARVLEDGNGNGAKRPKPLDFIG